MDLEDLESNLNALRQLYGLLRKDGASQNLASDSLTDKSRLLLKDLLDLAAEKIFKVHSKVLKGQDGLSLTKCSNNALQLSEGRKKLLCALLHPPETSTLINRCGNDLDHVDFTPVDCSFMEPPRQKPFTKPIQSVTTSGFGHGHNYCRICQRPITRNSTEQATVSDTRKGVKVTAPACQQNNQPNYFSWREKKEGLTANTELSEFGSTGKNRQRGTTGHDSTSSGIGSKDSCLNRPATAFPESEFIPDELTAKSTDESKDLDNLFKDASVVIKQIEMCIFDLQRGSGNSAPSRDTISPMHSEAQQELPDMVHDFVPKVESNCSIVIAKSLVATGSEPSQTVLSARCGNDLLNEVENGKCKDKSPQYQLPSRSTGSPTEIGLPYLTASRHLKPLPPTKTMATPVSSQIIGRCTGLAAGQDVRSEIGNFSEEIKGRNQMEDLVFSQNVNSSVAKIGSLKETTNGNCQMPTQIDNCNSSWPDENKISKRAPSRVTCLPQQINENDLLQNQMVLENYITKPGTCQKAMLSRVSKDYLNCQNIHALDSRCKMNQTWVSRSRKALPWQINKWQTYKPEYLSALFTNSKWMDRNQVGVQNTSDHNCFSRKILQHQDISDDASSNSNSSNQTSKKTSMSDSGSEEYHLPGEIQKQNYVSSTTSTENDIYSPHPRSQGHYAGETDSDIEAYSWSSSDRAYRLTSCSSDERLTSSFPSSANSDHVFSIGSESEGDDYSMYNQPRVRHYKQPRYLSASSTSKKFCPTRVYKSDKGMNSSKRIGQWKKLKDKLSIIFLHHHHHHHHNHTDDEDPGNNETRMGHGRFRLKHAMKTSHPMRTEAYVEQAFAIPGKSVIHSQDRKKQHNHFSALVGGLFKHMRHSKESKPFAKHIKQFGKGKQEGKKVLEKLHWWQLLQRHRKVKKLGLSYGKR